MTLAATTYLVLGLVVAVSLFLIDRHAGPSLYLVAGAFWPFFAPSLLARAIGHHPPPTLHPALAPRDDDTPTDARLAAVQQDLLEALGRLEGVADDLLTPERRRILSVIDGLDERATRLAELDRLIDDTERHLTRVETDDAAFDPKSRRVARLRLVREAHAEGYEDALLQLEELVTSLQLLRFVPPDREDREGERHLVSQLQELLARVEGIGEGLQLLAPDGPGA